MCVKLDTIDAFKITGLDGVANIKKEQEFFQKYAKH
jgi:hypothetical protein